MRLVRGKTWTWERELAAESWSLPNCSCSVRRGRFLREKWMESVRGENSGRARDNVRAYIARERGSRQPVSGGTAAPSRMRQRASTCLRPSRYGSRKEGTSLSDFSLATRAPRRVRLPAIPCTPGFGGDSPGSWQLAACLSFVSSAMFDVRRRRAESFPACRIIIMHGICGSSHHIRHTVPCHPGFFGQHSTTRVCRNTASMRLAALELAGHGGFGSPASSGAENAATWNLFHVVSGVNDIGRPLDGACGIVATKRTPPPTQIGELACQ